MWLMISVVVGSGFIKSSFEERWCWFFDPLQSEYYWGFCCGGNVKCCDSRDGCDDLLAHFLVDFVGFRSSCRIYWG